MAIQTDENRAEGTRDGRHRRHIWKPATTSTTFIAILKVNFAETSDVETHGPLGTLWAGLALGGFYLALIWVNLLLGHMLTPLFLIPLTWLQDKLKGRRVGMH